jgi:hypothetical protein
MNIGSGGFYPSVCRNDGNGGRYILTPSATQRLEHVDGNGINNLSQRYLHALGGAFSWRELLVLPDHSPVLIGRLNIVLDSWISVLHLDTAGVPVQFDLYDVGDFGNETQRGWINDQGNLAMVIGSGPNKTLVVMDPSGTPVQSALLTADTINGLRQELEVTSVAYRGDSLYLAGNLKRTDLVFSTAEYAPSTWVLPGLSGACLVGPATVNHIPAPLSAINTITSSVYASPPPLVTSQPVTLQAVSPTPFTQVCGTSGMDLPPGVPAAMFKVLNNPVIHGELLSLWTATTCTLQLMDMTGRVVHLIDGVNGSFGMATDDLRPGVYLLVGQNDAGASMGTVRVVIQ